MSLVAGRRGYRRETVSLACDISVPIVLGHHLRSILAAVGSPTAYAPANRFPIGGMPYPESGSTKQEALFGRDRRLPTQGEDCGAGHHTPGVGQSGEGEDVVWH